MSSVLSTLSDIYTNISGPAAVGVAIMTYFTWGRTLISKKIFSLVIILGLGGLLSADILARHPTWIGQSEFIVVTHKHFQNEIILMDGYDYEDCTFVNVKLKYNGGRGVFNYNTVDGAVFTSDKAEVMDAWILMAKAGLLKYPAFTTDGTPISPSVTPGTPP